MQKVYTCCTESKQMCTHWSPTSCRAIRSAACCLAILASRHRYPHWPPPRASQWWEGGCANSNTMIKHCIPNILYIQCNGAIAPPHIAYIRCNRAISPPDIPYIRCNRAISPPNIPYIRCNRAWVDTRHGAASQFRRGQRTTLNNQLALLPLGICLSRYLWAISVSASWLKARDSVLSSELTAPISGSSSLWTFDLIMLHSRSLRIRRTRVLSCSKS